MHDRLDLWEGVMECDRRRLELELFVSDTVKKPEAD